MAGERRDIPEGEPNLYWTTENIEHIARHGVSPAEVVEVWSNGPRFYERKSNDETLVMLGPNLNGRYLYVVLAEAVAMSDAWYVVTAHWMSRRRAERIYNRG